MNDSKNDIRIIQLKHYYGSQRQIGDSSHHTFTYFDEIEVLHVADENSKLSDAYQRLTECISNSLSDGVAYHSQQTILAISGDKSESEMRMLNAFWRDKTRPWFFLTLINVPLSVEINEAAEHVKSMYANEYHQIYYSFEFNEILVFSKSNSFKETIDTISQLNFADNAGSSTPVLDTVTICGYQKDGIEYSNELLNVQISLGITNNESYNDFISQFSSDTILRSISHKSHKIIGRNDVCLVLEKATLKQLIALFTLYEDKYANNAPFISTYEIMLMPYNTSTISPLGKNSLSIDHALPSALIEAFDYLHKKLCYITSNKRKNGDYYIRDTSKRIFMEMEIMLKNPLVFQLASDFVVCLLPQLLELVIYVSRAQQSEYDKSQVRVDTSERDYENLMNTFYLDVSSLVSSTVHSARQFFQIPHCGVTSLEMPPKILAFYSIMARKISDALNDNSDMFCGVALSPRLVKEPGVIPLPIIGNNSFDVMLSISISENMLYDPIRTLFIFGHELSHFIGERARCRAIRKRWIAAYYIHEYLQELFEIYRDLVGADPKSSFKPYFDTKDLLDTAVTISETIYPVEKDTENNLKAYINTVSEDIINLHDRLVLEEGTREYVSSKFIYGCRKPLFGAEIRRNMSLMLFGLTGHEAEIEDGLFVVYVKKAFDTAVDQYLRRFSDCKIEKIQGRFNGLIKYLFQESYADISMVLLYDMSPEEYSELFVNGRKNDDTEFARFHAVARAMHEAGIWENGSESVLIDDVFNSPDWDSQIQDLRKICLNGNWGDASWQKAATNKLSAYYIVDWPLQSVLIKYLISCIVTQKYVLLDNKKAAKDVKDLFRTIDLERPAYSSVCMIHKLEREYLLGTIDRYTKY